jgi:hypothetical protein
MKKLTLLLALLIVLIIAGASAFAKTGNPESVRVLSVKRDIFYFRVSQSFIGGTVEVYGEDGKLIFSDKIIGHKAILDFFFQDAGLYDIRIKKDDREVSFGYTKSTPKPEVEVSTEEVPMLQQG